MGETCSSSFVVALVCVAVLNNLSNVNRRSRDILRRLGDFRCCFVIESEDIFTSLGERVRLYQGIGNEIALSFRRTFNEGPLMDDVGVRFSIIVIDGFRLASGLDDWRILEFVGGDIV